jgi:integrase
MSSLIRRPNGIYYQIINQGGKRIWRSTGARTHSAAIAAIHNGLERNTPKRCVTVSQFYVDFLLYARTNLAATTVDLYDRAVKNFIRLVGDRPLRDYTAQDVERFKSLRAREVGPITLNIGFRNVKAFFETAVKWQLIERNPFKGVKQVRVPPQRPTYLTKDDLKRVLAAIRVQWLKDIVCFAVSTMMRAGEIVNLRWEAVDVDRRLIQVENTDTFRIKTTKPRSIPMNGWVYQHLSSRKERTGYVFMLPCGRKATVRHASRTFKLAVRSAGLSEDVHFHSLRHTGASWLVQDGVSIFAVQKILGHSNIQVTMIYSHLSSSELHGAIDRIRIQGDTDEGPTAPIPKLLPEARLEAI